VKKRKTSILLWSITVAAALTLLSGCIKSVDPPSPTPAKAYISIMHLAPTAPSLDVFFNDNKVSNNAFAPGNSTLAYNAVDRGAFSIKFKKESSDSVVAAVPLVQYDSLHFYTVFVYNLQADGPAEAVRIEDDFSNLVSGKPFYRFFHASPNTGPVDLYLDNVKIESDRLPSGNTTSASFKEIAGTASVYHNLEVKLAGTDSTIASLPNTELLLGNGYTFYLRGLSGGTGSRGLSLGLLRAAY
jgi:hypothetical protein